MDDIPDRYNELRPVDRTSVLRAIAPRHVAGSRVCLPHSLRARVSLDQNKKPMNRRRRRSKPNQTKQNKLTEIGSA